MKTTIDIPDAIYRQLKARAALMGISMKALVLESVREKLAAPAERGETAGWRSVFGKAPEGSLDEVRAVIEEEFSRIDPDDWK